MILKYDYLIIMTYHFNQLENKMDLLFRKMNYICELLESQTMNRRPNPFLPPHHAHRHSRSVPTTQHTTNMRPTNIEDTLEFTFVAPDTQIPSNFLSNLLNPRGQSPIETGVTLNEIRTNTELHTIDSESEREETCSICRGDYSDNNIVRIINVCDHKFHSSCLDNWLSRNRTCPLCRAGVVEAP